jgi:hypothetical protein
LKNAPVVRPSDFGLLLAALSRERSGSDFGPRPSDLRLGQAPSRA